MSFAARTRYLMAMGLLPAVSACRADTPVENVPAVLAPAAAAPITPPATPTVVAEPVLPPPADPPPDPTVRRDAGGGAWVVVETVKAPNLDAPPRATCPSGHFCLPAPNVVSTAAATQVDCDASVTHPASGAPTADFDADLTARERTHRADACCYAWYQPCPGGRPLRAEGVPVLAPPELRVDWSTPRPITPHDLDATTRQRLASHWLGEAAAEHASVAAFARFSLQLLALAAPPELVSAAHIAALDEVRHAQQCYALAARYSGEQRGPGALLLPGGPLLCDPATVALETLRDGCLGESLAARAVAQAAAAAGDPEVARVLREIAADEENHAALAWQTVAWLLRRHPQPVRRALAAFLASVSRAADRGVPGDAHDDHMHGVLTPDQHLAVRQQTVDEIVVPCLQALLHADPAYAERAARVAS